MSNLEKLKARMAEVNALHTAIGFLDWDQQCYMPPGAANARAQHSGILSRMAHEHFISDETQKLLADAKAEGANEDDTAMLRVVQRDMDAATKLPAALVEEKSNLAAQAHGEWVTARKDNNFAAFAPTLERLFDICRQEAEHLGYKDHIYDALTDLYEEGATKAGWDQMFATIREPLVELVKRTQEAPPVDDSFLYGQWDEGAQQQFTEMLAQAVGFNFERGRQDTAQHPFCANFSNSDVRLTTRYKPYLGSAIFGTLHEAGHGMYEQGSPDSWDLSPLAGGVSLGFHESQSRTWENIVGRSRSFWSRYLGPLKTKFPALPDVDLDTFYRGINKVSPTLIRVEADELTYNLHIMVRFEVECAILSGALKVRDLPEFWNTKYQEYLGVTPPNDREGCLQDIHWSGGSVGYFPTYSMGNILSCQIWECLERDLGDTGALIADGKFQPILEWLQTNVYRQAKKYPPKELLQRITGGGLDSKPYLDAMTKKYSSLYGLKAGV